MRSRSTPSATAAAHGPAPCRSRKTAKSPVSSADTEMSSPHPTSDLEAQMIRKANNRQGFTLLELQVAIVLLAFGIMTICSLMASQTRLLKRLEMGFSSGWTVYVTRSHDPWVRNLSAPARVSPAPLTQTTPSPLASPPH